MELTDTIIANARAGDLDTLEMLDKNGFIIGVDETAEQFAERLAKLRNNIRELTTETAEKESFRLAGYNINSKQRIPKEIFAESAALTDNIYSFDIDWVPGFFINPSFSWLFGGCAFYGLQDFFVFFIIRRSFASRKRWLIYDREELLAHELCHVARIGLESHVFEEIFAYKTASSRFRRYLGGIFHRPADAFLLLGSTFLLLGAQVFHTFMFPAVNVVYFWSIVGAVILYMTTRHLITLSRLNKALRKLYAVSPDNGLSAAFRCTDEEIRELASDQLGDVRAWIRAKADINLRWQVIQKRFIPDGECRQAS